MWNGPIMFKNLGEKTVEVSVLKSRPETCFGEHQTLKIAFIPEISKELIYKNHF